MKERPGHRFGHPAILPRPPVLAGRQQFLRVQDARTTAFPDLSHTFGEQIAEGDLVATRMTQHGTHSGKYMGIPPTGRRTSMTGIAIHRVVGGKVDEVWPSPDLFGLLQQLGGVPPSGRWAWSLVTSLAKIAADSMCEFRTTAGCNGLVTGSIRPAGANVLLNPTL
jgi:predicted ester cyclase